MRGALHTPGSWGWERLHEGFRVTGPDPEDRAHGISTVAIVGSERRSDAEDFRNTMLIAAAPKLLAAAEKALDECCDLIATDAGRALQDAINKARGEA